MNKDVFDILKEERFKLKPFIRETERVIIETALQMADGCKSHAAEILGINRTTLVCKMKSMGMKLNSPPKRLT